MKKLALGAVGALAAGAALFAAPQAAQAQFLSVGFGSGYYGSPYHGYGHPYYGGSRVRVRFGAPAYSYSYPVSSYYDDRDDGYYAAPVVTRRVVYTAPRRVVRTRVVYTAPVRRAVRVRYF